MIFPETAFGYQRFPPIDQVRAQNTDCRGRSLQWGFRSYGCHGRKYTNLSYPTLTALRREHLTSAPPLLLAQP